MKLADEQLVLDTNILLHLLRGKRAAEVLERDSAVWNAYAKIDHSSTARGIKMGKNDLWIAATTSVTGSILLTTDGDFDHLEPAEVRVEHISESQLK